MKKLEELGISPFPWSAEDNLKSFPLSSYQVRCAMYDVASNVLPADSFAISATPDMYDALFNILAIENSGDWDNAERVHAAFKAAEAALAKASGEEEK